MAVEKRDAVADILLVQLGDLKLGEEELGQRNRPRLERKTLLEWDLVRHAERRDEDVHLAIVLGVEEEKPLRPVEGVEGNFWLVSEVAEEVGCRARARPCCHEVEVLVGARQRGRNTVGRTQEDRNSAE